MKELKFVYITECSGDLYGLDAEGQVWHRVWHHGKYVWFREDQRVS